MTLAAVVAAVALRWPIRVGSVSVLVWLASHCQVVRSAWAAAVAIRSFAAQAIRVARRASRGVVCRRRNAAEGAVT